MSFSMLTIVMWFITVALVCSVMGVVITKPFVSGVDVLCLIGMGIGIALMAAGTYLVHNPP